jgi:hypothetical protein
MSYSMARNVDESELMGLGYGLIEAVTILPEGGSVKRLQSIS